MKTFLLSLIWLIVFALIIAVLSAAEISGAPAPLPRRQKPAIIHCPTTPAHWYGYHTCSQWPGWTLHLMPGGQYYAFHGGGSSYEGTWRLASVEGCLQMRILEHPVNNPAQEMEYRLSLETLTRKQR